LNNDLLDDRKVSLFHSLKKEIDYKKPHEEQITPSSSSLEELHQGL
jgi:hypothetical protein